jgi:hypothetical protein
MEIDEYNRQLHELGMLEENPDRNNDEQRDQEGIEKRRITIERLIQGNTGNSYVNT